MRLIDADALIEKAYWHGEHPDVGNPFAEGSEAVDVSDIDEAPTIEAEPVRHGRWECVIEIVPGVSAGQCSECGRCDFVKNYCPNCGAKMDLKEVDHV